MAKKKELVCGIDVSARTLQVALRTLAGEIRDLEVPNTPEGHRALCGLLTKGGRPSRAILEATSLYGLDIALALHRKGVAVMVANPKAARRFIEARLTRAKTDRVDARGLLDFVERMEFVPWTPPSQGRLTLRMFARRIEDVTQQRTAEMNRLKALQATLEAPAAILADVAAAIKELETRLDQLLEAAVAVARGDTELRVALDVITSVRGIADKSAVALLGELLMLPADMEPDQVVAHAGLDPRPKESGTPKMGKRSISKVGNSHIRGALYMPALVAVRWEPAIKDHYERLLARGKLRMVALVAVMRKLLRALWRMLKTHTAFDAGLFGPKITAAA